MRTVCHPDVTMRRRTAGRPVRRNGSIICKCDEGWTGEKARMMMGSSSIRKLCVGVYPADCGRVCGNANSVRAPGSPTRRLHLGWRGLDSEFNKPEAWTTEGKASVEDSVAFSLGCDWASIKTKVTMPDYDDGVPIRVKLSSYQTSQKAAVKLREHSALHKIQWPYHQPNSAGRYLSEESRRRS